MPELEGVSVVVVNYQSGHHLGQCLDAIASQSDPPLHEVIVIDNASSDGSEVPARARAASDQRFRFIQSDHNRGLAGGVNLALREAQGRYLAVLNPDCRPEPGWLGALTEVLDSSPEVWAAAPLILLGDGSWINAAGQHLHVSGLGFNRLLGEEPRRAGAQPHQVPGLHGAAFLIRTDRLRALGGWDETGFLYHEDVALSWSIRLAGGEIRCVPQSRVRHDYFLTMYPEKLFLLERNRWALLLTHLRPATLVALAPMLLISELLVWSFCLLRGPRFLLAKARACVWPLANRRRLTTWRARVSAARRAGDRHLLAKLRWSYPLRQLAALGRERGISARRPPGGLPIGRNR